jgi:CRISPR-associated protein Cmr4
MKRSVNHCLYLALTRTPTHVGSGQGLGDIDLPVMRNTWGLPILPGSAVKGVLRQHAPQAWNCNENDITALFGPDRHAAAEAAVWPAGAPGTASKPAPARSLHAGMLAPQDACLLVMPVASLRGGWAWVTSPGLLRRFRRDASDGGLADLPDLPSAPHAAEARLPVAAVDALGIGSGGRSFIVLGEAVLGAQPDELVERWAAWLVARTCGADEPEMRAEFAARLVVVSDDLFADFVQTATEVRARVAVDEDRVPTEHALWREECVPADSLFWGLLSVMPVARQGVPPLPVAAALQRVQPTCMQIGGKASVGYGWIDFLPQHAAAEEVGA